MTFYLAHKRFSQHIRGFLTRCAINLHFTYVLTLLTGKKHMTLLS